MAKCTYTTCLHCVLSSFGKTTITKNGHTFDTCTDEAAEADQKEDTAAGENGDGDDGELRAPLRIL